MEEASELAPISDSKVILITSLHDEHKQGVTSGNQAVHQVPACRKVPH